MTSQSKDISFRIVRLVTQVPRASQVHVGGSIPAPTMPLQEICNIAHCSKTVAAKVMTKLAGLGGEVSFTVDDKGRSCYHWNKPDNIDIGTAANAVQQVLSQKGRDREFAEAA